MNKFKDTCGRWYTQSLFFETSQYDQLGIAIYTFGDTAREYKDKKYICFKDLYLSCEDPTEYEVATKYLGGWKHWLRLCSNKLIMAHIQDLRDELEVKLKSKGIKGMVRASEEEGGRGATAAKWLADRGWEKRKAGAPSKEEKTRELKLDKKLEADLANDMDRIIN